MAINHRQMEAFMAVMMCGSMTEAGKLLHVTQPAISRSMRDLEVAAGFKLFQRAGARIRPTAEAKQLHAEIERHMTGLQRIEEVLEDIRAMNSGGLRIGTMTAAGIGFLPRVVAAFIAKHPSVTVQMHIDNSQALLDQVILRQLEIGIGAFRADTKGATVLPLPNLEGMIALPTSHRLANCDIVEIEALAGENFIALGYQGLLRYRVDHAFSVANIKPHQIVETPLSITICNLVAAGVGVGIIDPFTALEIDDPRITIRPFRPHLPYEIAIAYSPVMPPSRLAKDFIAMVECAVATEFSGADLPYQNQNIGQGTTVGSL